MKKIIQNNMILWILFSHFFIGVIIYHPLVKFNFIINFIKNTIVLWYFIISFVYMYRQMRNSVIKMTFLSIYAFISLCITVLLFGVPYTLLSYLGSRIWFFEFANPCNMLTDSVLFMQLKVIITGNNFFS